MSDPDSRVRFTDEVVQHAIETGIACQDPEPIGDHAVLVHRPNDWTAEVIDLRPLEDRPRFREGAQSFSRWDSLVAYVDRYRTAATIAYAKEPPTEGGQGLIDKHPLLAVVLDDHEPIVEDFPSTGVGRQKHRAGLTLVPTAAARRWGSVFGGRWLNQEEFADLVVDGITEIVEPPGADLRDLIADLKVSRSVEARTLVSATGGSTVELAENVKLHGGIGNTLALPESFILRLQPWTAVDDNIVLSVVMKAKVDGNRIVFQFRAPGLADALRDVAETIVSLVADGTGISPLWTL